MVKHLPLITGAAFSVVLYGVYLSIFSPQQNALMEMGNTPSQTVMASADTCFAADSSNTCSFPAVGTLHLYGNKVNPGSVMLLIGGDGGWDTGITNIAKAIAGAQHSLVVGIDIVNYYKRLQHKTSACLYPAGDMENLSEFIQKQLHLPVYHKPLLVGYSSGATLTYALLCQAPAGTFLGGIALGFCPEIEISKPLCEGSGQLSMTKRKDGHGYDFNNRFAPAAPLEVLHGEQDLDCVYQKASDFFENVKNVNMVSLPKVGHGYKVTKNWMPQFSMACRHINDAGANTAGNNPAVTTPFVHKDLPVVAIPATQDGSTPMALFLSGDGGWTGFDQQISEQLSAKHIPVLGLNCQSYFWNKKTPEETVQDLAPVIRQYMQMWGKSKILLVGYSFGANVLPFIQNRLPADVQSTVNQMVLLSPDTKGDFEIHISGMLGQTVGNYDVAAEIKSLQRIHVLCVSGDEEKNELQEILKGYPRVSFEKIPGSHHYNGNAAKVATTISGTI